MDLHFPQSRRALLAAGLAGLAASVPHAEAQGRRATRDLRWGVNGHPFTAYPGISYEAQLDLAVSLGFRHYRVNTREDGSMEGMDALLPLAAARGVTILPIIHPPANMDRDTPKTLYDSGYELGRRMAERYRGRVPVWEISNELENYAIIQPCEMRDDGTKYPCEWGPAGGVGVLDYFGPRWVKVSAILKGLSEGVAAGDNRARRAMGTAGWGHVGAFDRFRADGLEWDITVWHAYEPISQQFLTHLASFGKPIWITEFNAGGGGLASPEENARRLTESIAEFRRIRTQYRVEAAYLYELFDEPYWSDSEARMGIVGLDSVKDGWRIGAVKPAGEAVRAAIRRNNG